MLSALERKVLVGKESRGAVETEAQLYEVCLTWSGVPDFSQPFPRDPLIIPNLGFSR